MVMARIAGVDGRSSERDEISVEREFADELWVGLGSVLTLDVQGIDLDLTVTSLREVDWGTFARWSPPSPPNTP